VGARPEGLNAAQRADDCGTVIVPPSDFRDGARPAAVATQVTRGT